MYFYFLSGLTTTFAHAPMRLGKRSIATTDNIVNIEPSWHFNQGGKDNFKTSFTSTIYKYHRERKLRLNARLYNVQIENLNSGLVMLT